MVKIESNKNEKQQQGNIYDKLFKESMHITLPAVMKHALHLEVETLEELKDDIQYTKERKTDRLTKVRDKEGNIFIIHLEYQTANYDKMNQRMLEYYCMLRRRYSLPIKQYVIYIGAGRSNMPTIIEETNLKFRYILTALSEVDYNLFMESEEIEQKLLAVLGDMRHQDPEVILKDLVQQIQDKSHDQLTVERHLQQLHVLVQLRNFETKLSDIMLSVSTFFKEERDPMYQRGAEKGKLEGERKRSLEIAHEMKREGYSIEQIVKITKLTEKEIKNL